LNKIICRRNRAINFCGKHGFICGDEEIRMLLANLYDTEISGAIPILKDDLALVEFYNSFVQNIR
jgi:hypothetical protein